MKFFIKNNRFVLAILMFCSVIMAGCEEGDGDADYGFGYVYMPQATVSGGLNNHYPVPSGGGISTYNFIEKDGKVNIFLSVLRSGKISGAAGFTVDVAVSQAETERIISSGEVSNGIVMPSGMYELPNKVTVEPGKDAATFYLSLDVEQLSHYTYIGKELVLVVGINNPTHYELSDENTSTVVIVDVDALLDIISNPQ